MEKEDFEKVVDNMRNNILCTSLNLKKYMLNLLVAFKVHRIH